MQSEKLRLGLTLFFLGFSGVLSVLTAHLPLEQLPAEVSEQFSPQSIRLLMLINPTILLFIAVVAGMLLHESVRLQLPLLKKLLQGEKVVPLLQVQMQSGMAGGLAAGLAMLLIAWLFQLLVPEEFALLSRQFQPSVWSRFLYGGVTEEILMRFGLMTFLVWIISAVFKTLGSRVYWTGIVLTALLFAAGHLPLAYLLLQQPSGTLLLYVLLGNTAAGIVYGWLYWKKGLEAAIIAHIFTHVLLLVGEGVFQLA